MSIAIGLGLMEFPFADAGGYWRWVDLCEAGGIDSLWQTDRLVCRQPILECMTTMAALAGHTRRIKFGMNVVSLDFRDPVLLARQCTTIDVLSDGRLLPGFGIGSPLAPEWQALGGDTAGRGARTDEALNVLTRLWHEETVDFEGRFFHLRGVSIAPRPAAGRFAVGDAATILARLRAFIDQGVSKFILHPLAQGEVETLKQTRRLIETILPAIPNLDA